MQPTPLPACQDDGERSSFPLYTEAVKFINHRDGMVRAAVRTLTLNVYTIRDPAVQAFVISKPASNYFNELAIFVAEQCEVRTHACAGLSTAPCIDNLPPRMFMHLAGDAGLAA